MGERLTYGILARYCVVLVERLGGLFFAGRRSCTEDYSGLYCGDYLTVSIISCLCVILSRRALTLWVLKLLAKFTPHGIAADNCASGNL